MQRIRLLIPLFIFILCTQASWAHCDTKDGPVVTDAIKAIKYNNVNYTLKWVQPDYQDEIKQAFGLMMKVRTLSPEARQLADNYFFETLVRLHRAGEGMSYTGIRPPGTPVDGKILAADKSIALGNLDPLKEMVKQDRFPELQKRFENLMSLKDFDVNDVAEGRKYIEAYVQFFHFAEGEATHHPVHLEDGRNPERLPWLLTAVFFTTTLLFSILFFRKRWDAA